MRYVLMSRRTFCTLLGFALTLGTAGRSTASPYKVTVLDGNGGSLIVQSGQSLDNLGQVAGTWLQDPGGNGAGGEHPYFYDPTEGGKVSLPGLISPSGQDPGSYSYKGDFLSLNDSGQAVGWNAQGTILYDSKTGQVTNLPGPTGLITDSGRVYGSGYQLVGWAPHLYSSQNGAVQDLGTPSAATGVSVMASNNSGQVLVNAFMGSGQGGAFLYSGGKWTALPNFVAAAMNAQGALAGSTSTNALGNAQAAVISSSGALYSAGD